MTTENHESTGAPVARPTSTAALAKIIHRMANLGGPAGREDLRSNLGGKLGIIYSQIENRLVTGRYQFGQEIRNSDLVKEFNASRGPITMALNLLRSQGYLVVRPQVGVWVVTPSPFEIREFFEILARSESVHAAGAAERATADQIELLNFTQASIAQIPCQEGAPKNLERLALVGLFHEQIRTMGSGSWLARQTASVWKMSNFLLSNITPTQSSARLLTESEKRHALVDAIRARDSQRAASVMEEYIRTRGSIEARHKGDGA